MKLEIKHEQIVIVPDNIQDEVYLEAFGFKLDGDPVRAKYIIPDVAESPVGLTGRASLESLSYVYRPRFAVALSRELS